MLLIELISQICVGTSSIITPYRKPFRTADGFISIIPYNIANWIAFLKIIGRDDLVDDPRVTDAGERSRNTNMLYALIDEASPSRTTADWLALLRKHDIPCSQVNKLNELFEHPHLQAVEMFAEEVHPTEGRLTAVRPPFRVVGEAALPDRATPPLGGDSGDVLRAASLTDEAIDALFARGVAAGAARAAKV